MSNVPRKESIRIPDSFPPKICWWIVEESQESKNHPPFHPPEEKIKIEISDWFLPCWDAVLVLPPSTLFILIDVFKLSRVCLSVWVCVCVCVWVSVCQVFFFPSSFSFLPEYVNHAMWKRRRKEKRTKPEGDRWSAKSLIPSTQSPDESNAWADSVLFTSASSSSASSSSSSSPSNKSNKHASKKKKGEKKKV